MMAAAIMATAANRSRTNRTMMIPISAPPKHRSQANAATCVGSRQLQQYVEYECCKFGRGRMIGSGVIRRLSAANATRPEKRSGPSASREVARIESDAALTDSTLDRLLQPVGWVERQRNPSSFAETRAISQIGREMSNSQFSCVSALSCQRFNKSASCSIDSSRTGFIPDIGTLSPDPAGLRQLSRAVVVIPNYVPCFCTA